MRLDELDLKPEDYAPKPPTGPRLKIGLVGCGAVANSAHLPAYRDFGYEVVACMDIDAQAVESTRRRWGIPRVGTDLAALLDDPEVEVVDLAVHANVRSEVLLEIAAAGKPILSQKPLAMDWASARQMVRGVEQAGVPLMINQQARWAPAHRAIKALIDRGVCGPLYSVTHVRRSWQDHPDRWWRHLTDFNVVDHGVHYIDLARHFTGRSPDAVTCTTSRVPGQRAVSPLCHSLLMHFDSGDLLCTEHFNNIVTSPASHSDTWYLDGVDGSIVGTQQWVEISRRDAPDSRVRFPVEGRWFPDAFGGSMAEMMTAVTEGREPQTSGRDNLKSINIAFAAVRSSEEGRTVRLSEFD
ncbi:MAG: Gfo/Idh/MocA family oxidoreductase [Chloroflexi bacterium]|nr:Gfo/Idh/MocA family oxidoreductase [Chloroflexota bacterium]